MPAYHFEEVVHILRYITACIFLFLLVVPLQAQQTNSYIYPFLNLPTSARIGALGGEHPSLLQGDASLFNENPAYLNKSSHRQGATSYINYLSDINFGFLNGAYHIDSIGTIASGIRYVNYGEFPHTDEIGNELGTFRAMDLAWSMGLGRSYKDNIQYGAAVEFIYSKLESYTSAGLAVSAGASYKMPEQQMNIAMVVKNLGYQIVTYDRNREALPLNILLGLTKKLEHLPLRLSLTMNQLNRWDMRTAHDDTEPDFFNKAVRHLIAGGEFILGDHVQLRLGYNHMKHVQLTTSDRLDTAGMSVGVGILIKEIQIDISRYSYSEMGGIFQLSVRTTL